MTDYVKSLESRNEELQQSLAKALTEINELKHLKKIIAPTWWEENIIHVGDNRKTKKIKEYVFSSDLCKYATVRYDAVLKKWCADSEMMNPKKVISSKVTLFKKRDDAVNYIEDVYNCLVNPKDIKND